MQEDIKNAFYWDKGNYFVIFFWLRGVNALKN
jgi:hypothetical protein